MTSNILRSEYSHYSLKEIKNYLKQKSNDINNVIKQTDIYIKELGTDWAKLDHDDFVCCVRRCKNFLNTAKEDIKYVIGELDEEIKEHHINMIYRISYTSNEFNKEISFAKNQGVRRIDDGAEYSLYSLLRDNMIFLTNLSEIANRLKDFSGKKKRHIPWDIIFSNIFAFCALIVSILAYLKQ